MSVRIAAASVITGALLCLTEFCFAQVQAPVQPPVIGQRGTPTTRSVEGIVRNQSGASVPGARVLLKNGKTLQVRSFIAQQDGRYHFYGLSTEVDYEIRAQSNGMTSKTKNISVFNSRKVVHLDLKLTRKLKAEG
jgi:hypothetical protein